MIYAYDLHTDYIPSRTKLDIPTKPILKLTDIPGHRPIELFVGVFWSADISLSEAQYIIKHHIRLTRMY